jgi:hypothetical protein
VRHSRSGDPVEFAVDQRGRRGQRLGQRIERRRGDRQALGVPRQAKVWVHAVAQHVGQIVDVQAGQVLGTIGGAQRAERPAQRVLVLVLAVAVA